MNTHIKKIPRCLIVEDDADIAELLKSSLEEVCGEVELIGDGLAAVERLKDFTEGLVIMDLNLPSLICREILRRFRKYNNETPVLFLSATGDTDTKVELLTKGGDDFIEKPFSPLEVRLRAMKLYSRSNPIFERQIIQYKNLHLDRRKRQVKCDDEILNLQPKEYHLLELFMMNPCQLVSKEVVLKEVFGLDFSPPTNIVDVLVCRLRAKLDSDHAHRWIRTVRGAGYRFD